MLDISKLNPKQRQQIAAEEAACWKNSNQQAEVIQVVDSNGEITPKAQEYVRRAGVFGSIYQFFMLSRITLSGWQFFIQKLQEDSQSIAAGLLHCLSVWDPKQKEQLKLMRGVLRVVAVDALADSAVDREVIFFLYRLMYSLDAAEWQINGSVIYQDEWVCFAIPKMSGAEPFILVKHPDLLWGLEPRSDGRAIPVASLRALRNAVREIDRRPRSYRAYLSHWQSIRLCRWLGLDVKILPDRTRAVVKLGGKKPKGFR